METVIVTSKQVRQRLGTYMLDLKYKPETVICVNKPGTDDHAAIICNAQWLRDQGVDIPELEKSKAEKKKK